MRQLKALHIEYDKLNGEVIQLLKSSPGPNHFDVIRLKLNRMEEIDRLLTSSSVVRATIDVPEGD